MHHQIHRPNNLGGELDEGRLHLTGERTETPIPQV